MATQWSKHLATHLYHMMHNCINGEWYKQHSGLSMIQIFISVTFCHILLIHHGTRKNVFISEILKNELFLAGVKMCSNLHCWVTHCRRVECVQVNNIRLLWLNQMKVIIYRQLRWEVVCFAVNRARGGIYESCGCGGATLYLACNRTLDIESVADHFVSFISHCAFAWSTLT